MVPAKCQDSTSRKVENLDNLPGQLMEPIDERNIFRNPARWPSKSYKETRKKNRLVLQGRVPSGVAHAQSMAWRSGPIQQQLIT